MYKKEIQPLPEGFMEAFGEKIKSTVSEASCKKKMEEDQLDPVNKKAVKKDFDDRQDKDIDNDGDVDSSDEYLHKRRKAVSKAISKQKEANEAHIPYYGEDEEDLAESHFKVGDEVVCVASGMEGEVVEVGDEEKEEKYYTVKREDGKTMKYAPDELKLEDEDDDEEELDEGMGRYTHYIVKDSNGKVKHHQVVGDESGNAEMEHRSYLRKSVMKDGDKLVSFDMDTKSKKDALKHKIAVSMKEEKKLEKDKDDPCWKDYVQLGTKKKNGKEVPNCVPKEEVEEGTDFASHRAKPNLTKDDAKKMSKVADMLKKERENKMKKEEVELDEAGNTMISFIVRDKEGKIKGGTSSEREAKSMAFRINGTVETLKKAISSRKLDSMVAMGESVELDEFYDDNYDTGASEEVTMGMRQLYFIQYAAEEIMDYLEMRGDMDEWFQNKLSNAHNMLQGLHSYIEGDKRMQGFGEEVDLDEARQFTKKKWIDLSVKSLEQLLGSEYSIAKKSIKFPHNPRMPAWPILKNGYETGGYLVINYESGSYGIEQAYIANSAGKALEWHPLAQDAWNPTKDKIEKFIGGIKEEVELDEARSKTSAPKVKGYKSGPFTMAQVNKAIKSSGLNGQQAARLRSALTGMNEEVELDEAGKAVTWTSGHKPDKKHTFSVMIDGEEEGTYHSLEQAKKVVTNRKKSSPDRKYKIVRNKRTGAYTSESKVELEEKYEVVTVKTIDDAGEDKALSYGRKKGYKEAGVIGDSPIKAMVLFHLKPEDKKDLKGANVKAGEQVFRYATRSTVAGDIFPMIKVNFDKGMVYYLTQESSSGEIDEVKFETRGAKLKFARMMSGVVEEVELEESRYTMAGELARRAHEKQKKKDAEERLKAKGWVRNNRGGWSKPTKEEVDLDEKMDAETKKTARSLVRLGDKPRQAVKTAKAKAEKDAGKADAYRKAYESVDLEEKAVSQAQQKLMGMALAYKRGEMDDASDEVKKVANSMSEKDLEDFAKTKHDDLPMKKEKYLAAAYKTIKSQKKY